MLRFYPWFGLSSRNIYIMAGLRYIGGSAVVHSTRQKLIPS